MRLLNANIVYLMPNITSKNNTFVYNDDYIDHTIIFDDWIYGIQNINKNIDNSLFITTDDPKFQFIHFKALESTSYIRLYVAHGYTVKTCNADKLMMKNDINTLVQIYKNVKMI